MEGHAGLLALPSSTGSVVLPSRLDAYPGGTWRTERVGHVLTRSSRPTPMVRVLISTLTPDGTREYRIIELSCWLWPVLIVGHEWTDGLRDPSSTVVKNAQTVDVVVEDDRMDVAPASEREGPEVLIPESVWNTPLAFDIPFYLILKRPHSDGIGDLIIPCAEIYRAYYGHVARVAHLILTGSGVDPDAMELYLPTQSVCANGRAFVMLGKRVPDYAAQMVARIAFDPFAKHAVRRIVGDMGSAQTSQRAYPMITFPPFRGEASWTVVGRQIGSDRSPRFLVDRLVYCTGAVPFTVLESGAENPRGNAHAASANDLSGSLPFVASREPTPADPLGIVDIFEDQDPDSRDTPLNIFDLEIEPVTSLVVGG